ncbi:5-oxoprolinase subunit B family protein [Nonlabens sp. YIK11]|uniref:5-oxoprolinase subunit B family protein n=1 Tax=Nonlabens sp. YIK11 TaxID=1453349 RepID=UPI0006DCF4B4|nr:carboxyltransferase domain-containing protein [Nonlabens sp. YIK11]
MPNTKLKYYQVSENAIEISWPTSDGSVWLERHMMALELERFYGDQVVVNEGYFSILVVFKKPIRQYQQRLEELKSMSSNLENLQGFQGTKWQIPVLYDRDSEDLLSISKHTLLTFESIVKMHEQAIYTVEFIGFLPGFPYLSGLPEKLQIPRRKTPNPSIAPGSVAIAAGQCGVYPQTSPGGWYVLGKSPLEFFDVHREQPNLLSIGDQVKFYGINQQEYDRIKNGRLNVKEFHSE